MDLFGQATICLETTGYALQRAEASPDTPGDVVQACGNMYEEIFVLYDQITLKALEEATLRAVDEAAEVIAEAAVNGGLAFEEEENSETTEPMDPIEMITRRKAEVATLLENGDYEDIAEVHALVSDPNANRDQACRALQNIDDVRKNPFVAEAIKTVENLVRDIFVLYTQTLCRKTKDKPEELRNEFLGLAKCYFQDDGTKRAQILLSYHKLNDDKNDESFRSNNYLANQRRGGKKRPRRRSRPSCRPPEGQVPAPEAPDSADALPDNHETKKTRKRNRSGESCNSSVRKHDWPQAYPYMYQPFVYPPGIINSSSFDGFSFYSSAPWANPQSMYGHCDWPLMDPSNFLPSYLLDEVLDYDLPPSSGRKVYIV